LIWILGCSGDPPIDDSEPVVVDSEAEADADSDADTDTDTDTDTSVEPITRVYLLAGQSNMDGYGQLSSLPVALRDAQDDVFIWWSGAASWRGLQPSSWVTGDHGIFFGPEMGFGRRLADVHSRDEVRLIKHAVGGTNLAEYWYPGASREDASMGEGYRVFIETVEAARAELGPHEIAGMAWMQGESDAVSEVHAAAYEDNIRHFLERVRQDVGDPDMPFVMGAIECPAYCTWQEDVIAGMRVLAEAEGVHVVETADLRKYPNDYWHYQGPGQRVLGRRMADALAGESVAAAVEPALTLTGTYTWSYTGDYTVGWRFTNSEGITVTDLGVFDLGDDGLNHASEVVLWDASTGSRMASATVPSGTAAATVGSFRYAGISAVTLPAGDWIVASQAFGTNPDDYMYGAETATVSGLTWVEGRHSAGSAQNFPTHVVESTPDAALWFGGNLLIEQ